MPSGHGGGGSGGSHGGSFGGGGHSGGFGRGGTGSGSSNTYLAPRFIRFGNSSIIVSSGRRVAISYLIFFLISTVIISISCFSLLKQSENRLKVFESDNVYYLNMIENAEADPLYKVVGRVTGVKYNEDFEKWYIEYVFTNDAGTIEGYSYCVYSERFDAPAFNEAIDIAIDSYNSIEADSMPMDYKNFTILDDGEYVYTLKQVNASRLFGYVGAFASVAIIIGIVYVIVSSKKINTEELEKQKANLNSGSVNPEKKYCAYCGSEISAGETKCPCCGSSKVYQQKGYYNK